MLRLLEAEGEGVEDLGGAEPDVPVASGPQARAEVFGVLFAQRAVDAVGGHDEIGVGQLVGVGDPVLELQPYAQLSGPAGEDVEELVPADAEALVALLPGSTVAHVGDSVVPGHRGVTDGPRGLGVVLVELVEQSAPVGDAPAVGRARRVALVHGDVVGRILQLHQDREIQAGGPASDTSDLHTHP